jgi:hypothetical protein
MIIYMTKYLCFRFDFSGSIPLVSGRQSEVSFTVQSNGSVDGILMWWDLQMDTKGEIDLSCAPDWAHPKNLKHKYFVM